MPEISNTQNLNAHYSTNSKVERPEHAVAQAPGTIPNGYKFNDRVANKKMQTICNDIYVDTKSEQSSDGKKFVKVFGIGTAGILGIIGLRNLFK